MGSSSFSNHSEFVEVIVIIVVMVVVIIAAVEKDHDQVPETTDPPAITLINR